jgi:hypothetical protein
MLSGLPGRRNRVFKSKYEILETEHKILRQFVDRMKDKPVNAEKACSLFFGVVSMTDALFEEEGDG